jgi:hypothetical protein
MIGSRPAGDARRRTLALRGERLALGAAFVNACVSTRAAARRSNERRAPA